MLNSKYTLAHETPSSEEFCSLRVLSGMTPRTIKGASIGLPNTFFAVTIRLGGKLIGMGRIVGDGGLSFQIVDIAVDPAHQGVGLGTAIMASLVERLQNIPGGAHISLMADGPAKHLYAKFGFYETAPASVGMELPRRE